MNVEIAPLADHDVDALCELASIIWRQHYPPIIGAAQTEYMLAQRYAPSMIRAELAAGNAWWDVLCIEQEMVAFACSFPADAKHEMKLDKLYVHQDFHGRGVGSRLIATAEGAARGQGCSALVLNVNKHNGQAIRAYERNGFTIREAVMVDIGGGFVMDDYVMAKPL